MQTNVILSVCPNCGAIDSNEQLSYTLVDTVLSVECTCPKCKKTWRNAYGLFYLGYTADNCSYDRDGLEIRY